MLGTASSSLGDKPAISDLVIGLDASRPPAVRGQPLEPFPARRRAEPRVTGETPRQTPAGSPRLCASVTEPIPHEAALALR
jgi:hypothetical protein